MFSQVIKHITVQVFLIAFILLKASGLHAFAHSHDSQNNTNLCFICHISSRDDTTPLISIDNNVDFVNFSDHYFMEVIDSYENLASKKLCISELLNKPPPLYTVS